jgi:hypothetical protein
MGAAGYVGKLGYCYIIAITKFPDTFLKTYEHNKGIIRAIP